MTVEALFPRSHYRLARMVDADKQISALLDAFEREGMPMGSEFWAGHCLAQLHRRLEFLVGHPWWLTPCYLSESFYRMGHHDRHPL